MFKRLKNNLKEESDRRPYYFFHTFSNIRVYIYKVAIHIGMFLSHKTIQHYDGKFLQDNKLQNTLGK